MSSTQIIILIIISIVLLLLSSFFSAAETAYSSITKFTIEKNLKKNKRSAKLIKKHYKSFGWVLATILFGNNIVNVALSSISTIMFAHFLSNNDTIATIVSTIVITPIIVVIGEIVPKLFAKKYGYQYLSKVVYIIDFLSWIIFPITYPFSKLVLSSKTNITEKEIKDIAHLAAHQKQIKDDEALIVSKSLELNSLDLRQIMIKKQDFVDIKAHFTIAQALKVFQKTGHSRLPIFKNNDYASVLLLKNIIYVDPNENVLKYAKSIPILSKNLSVTKALEKLRAEKTHIAFVFTMYKQKRSIVGLVTIEDIFEEIFGEISDEHDQIELINQVAPNKWIVDGTVLMQQLETVLHKIKFEHKNKMNVKEWIQKKCKTKIKINYKYTYKNSVVFRVIANKKNQETQFEIRQKLR